MAEVVVVGGCNFDIKAKTKEANTLGTSNPGRVTTSPGGVARNISHNLAVLGHEVALISMVGDDAFGTAAVEATAAAGVDISRIGRAAKRTGTYIAVLDPEGELMTAVNDMDAIAQLTPAVVMQHVAVLEQAKLVVADCNLPIETLMVMADWCRQKFIIETVSIPKSEKLSALLSKGHIHLATPNFDQVEALVGTRDIEHAFTALHAKGLRNAVIHAGAEGAFVSDGSEIAHIEPSLSGPVIDVTGAGDAAVAGLTHGLLQGASLAEAALQGQVMAGRVVASERSYLERP
jgi:pseudouridine kinase